MKQWKVKDADCNNNTYKFSLLSDPMRHIETRSMKHETSYYKSFREAGNSKQNKNKTDGSEL